MADTGGNDAERDPLSPEPTLKTWRRQRTYLISWDRLGALLGEIAAALSADGLRPAAVVGIARGGLVPAVHLAHHFEVQDFRVISFSRTTSDNAYSEKQEPVLGWMSSRSPFPPGPVLLVDDVVGTGRTLLSAARELATMGPDAVITAAVTGMAHCTEKVDYCPLTLDDWVVFPWERHATEPASRQVVL